MLVCTQRTSRKFYHTNSETNVCVKRYETSWCRFRRCYWGQTTEGLTLAATQIRCNRTIAYCCLSLEFLPGVRISMGDLSWKQLSYRFQNVLKITISVSHDMFLFYHRFVANFIIIFGQICPFKISIKNPHLSVDLNRIEKEKISLRGGFDLKSRNLGRLVVNCPSRWSLYL